ncbi:MAG: hypothetical protein WKF57_13950 [Nakamurella sp.]
MHREPLIDTRFDVRRDSGSRDPDSHSATLRRYHRLLWGKPLPDGRTFELDARLRHRSDHGDFSLASDAITHTYRSWTRPSRLVDVVNQIPAHELTEFYDLGCTVGAYIVFPFPVRINDRWQMSINQARGIHPQIRDRFDITLECIRLWYSNEHSPFAHRLDPYAFFFGLFPTFRGYVTHFLLDDLVTPDYTGVRFHVPFEGFSSDPLPVRSVEEYRKYMQRSSEFVRARNIRINRYSSALERAIRG